MARLNIETKALAESRFHNFMRDLGLTHRHEALGLLAIFWHDTQERMIISGSKKELLKFIDSTKENREKIFEALLENDYLSEVETGLFEIKGNSKHVRAFQALKNRQKNGGLKSGETRRSKNNAKSDRYEKIEVRTSKIEVDTSKNRSQCNSIQSNSKHLSSKQSKAKQSSEIEESFESPGGPREKKILPQLQTDDAVLADFLSRVTLDTQKTWLKLYSDPKWILTETKNALDWMTAKKQKVEYPGHYVSRWFKRKRGEKSDPLSSIVTPEQAMQNKTMNQFCWLSYRDAYKGRYKVEPTRNAKVNSLIGHFVNRVGADAPKILEFYLDLNNAFYVQRMHALDLAVRDAEALRTQWLTKKPLRDGDLKQFQKSSQMRAQVNRIENGEI